ncbi:U3 snoRNP protein [Blastocladiella emersonii ATCC 22665]|nr:U3 snoRNP protein [Blastocladiella emersonii ATCC 22665]
MADSVNIIMEAMVPELKDAERKKLFTATEVKMIVDKRRNFEYALRRRGAILADYIKYIDYEWSLEKTRRKRIARFGLKYKTSLIDHAGVRHLHNLYNRAVSKFPGDVDLWIAYATMAKRCKSYRRISSIYARALQLHPRNASLWILAAAWEFEDQGNAASARKLMQRAVHFNREMRELWIEWFKLECMYVTKIRARAEILDRLNRADSEADSDMDEDEDDAKEDPAVLGDDMDEDDLATPALPVPDNNAELSALDESLSKAEASAQDGADADPIVQYAIPRLVYAEAIAAHPADLALRRECLRIAVAAHGAQSVVDAILASIHTDLAPTSADAVVLATAWRVVPGVGGVLPSDPAYPAALHAAITDLDAAVAAAATPAPLVQSLRDAVLDFLAAQRNAVAAVNPDLAAYVHAQIRRHMVGYLAVADARTDGEPASPNGAPHALLDSTYVRLLEHTAALDAADAARAASLVSSVRIARQATAAYPGSADLACRRIALGRDNPAWAASMPGKFTRALDIVAVWTAVHALVRGSAKRAAFGAPAQTASVEDAMAQWHTVVRGTAEGRDADAVVEAKARFLASVVATLPDDTARDAFVEKFVVLIPIESPTWLTAVADTFSSAFSGDSAAAQAPPAARLAIYRRVMQLGARRWPTSVAWWLRYLQFEVQVARDVAGATQVYLSAVRAVGSDDAEALAAGWNAIRS